MTFFHTALDFVLAWVVVRGPVNWSSVGDQRRDKPMTNNSRSLKEPKSKGNLARRSRVALKTSPKNSSMTLHTVLQ